MREAALDSAATRHRLLLAAGEMFAEVGFEHAGVRDICAKARANVAAVKYHFGGKYPLYEAAIGYWLAREEGDRIASMKSALAADGPEAAFRTFVRAFVGRLLDRERPAWHARLVAREMAEPTAALDAMVARTVRPTIEHLRTIIRRLVGPTCPKLALERAMLSVISQCVFYVHCRPILHRVFPAHADAPDVAAIADHVATFSLAGIRAIAREPARKEKRR